jgi:hypothetical protein
VNFFAELLTVKNGDSFNGNNCAQSKKTGKNNILKGRLSKISSLFTFSNLLLNFTLQESRKNIATKVLG